MLCWFWLVAREKVGSELEQKFRSRKMEETQVLNVLVVETIGE